MRKFSYFTPEADVMIYRSAGYVMRSCCLLLLCGTVSVAGCSTAAQREFKATNAAGNVAMSEYKSCVSAIGNDPAFSDLSQHLLISSAAPTLEQLSDSAVPSPDQVSALLAWHKGIQSCRQNLLDEAQTSFAFMVPAYQQNYASLDAIYLRVAKRELAWGDANRFLAQARTDASARNREASSAWTSELKEENQEELERRSAAIQAMAVSLQQTGAAMQQQAQQQQLINAINRPVTTNCNQIGTYTNCTSQ